MKPGDAHDEPALLGRGMTGILDLEMSPPSGDDVVDSTGVVGGFAFLRQCRLANLEIAGPDAVVGSRELIFIGEPAPRLVDFQDISRFIEDRDVTRQSIEG